MTSLSSLSRSGLIAKDAKVVVEDVAVNVVVEAIVALLAKVARRLASKSVVHRHIESFVDLAHPAHMRRRLGLVHLKRI